MATNSNKKKGDLEQGKALKQQVATYEMKLTKRLLSTFTTQGKDITESLSDPDLGTVYQIELQQTEAPRSLYAIYKKDGSQNESLIVSPTLSYEISDIYPYRESRIQGGVHSIKYSTAKSKVSWVLSSIWPQNANGQSSGGQSLQTVTNVGLTGESLLETVKDIATHNVETLVAPEYLALERFLQDLQDIDNREREREQQNTATTVGVEASTTTTQGEYQGAEAAMSMLERGSSR